MHTHAHRLEPNLTEAVIGSAFEVSKVLGAGFLEKVYELIDQRHRSEATLAF